jgi:tetratricopeptide (TPR) repeat protein
MREGWEKAMKNFGIRIAGALAVCLLGLGLLAQPGRLMAQAKAKAPAVAPGTANIHGHVIDRAGLVVTNGDVRLTKDVSSSGVDRKFEYTLPLDANGNYKGTGIKPADYLAIVYQGSASVDFFPVTLSSGQDKTLDFDMTRKEYIDKLSSAERKQLEQFKKDHAQEVAKNSKTVTLNTLLTQARADTEAGNFASAIKAMTDATTIKPDEPLLWITLGDAQLGEAVTAERAAKAIHATDASVPDKLNAAVTSYQKALSLNASFVKPSADITAVVSNQLGLTLGRLGKLKEACDAYEAGAQADPTGAARYYFNEAVTLYNASTTTGKVDGIAEAADKVIALDPTKAEAYYLKTQGLAPLITQTPDGKFVAPPGLVEACNKYLQLAPTGVHAADMKGLIAGLNEQVQTNYKAAPKKK